MLHAATGVEPDAPLGPPLLETSWCRGVRPCWARPAPQYWPSLQRGFVQGPWGCLAIGTLCVFPGPEGGGGNVGQCEGAHAVRPPIGSGLSFRTPARGLPNRSAGGMAIGLRATMSSPPLAGRGHAMMGSATSLVSSAKQWSLAQYSAFVNITRRSRIPPCRREGGMKRRREQQLPRNDSVAMVQPSNAIPPAVF